MFELQSQWIAGVLSGRIGLPSHEEMMKDVEAFYFSLEAYGTPMWYTHKIGDYEVNGINNQIGQRWFLDAYDQGGDV